MLFFQLPAACLGKDAVKPCLLKSLKELNLKYVDLYLIHMPFGLKVNHLIVFTEEQHSNYSGVQ